jgi:uncharacterized protein YjiK
VVFLFALSGMLFSISCQQRFTMRKRITNPFISIIVLTVLVVLLFAFCKHSNKNDEEKKNQPAITGYDLKHPLQTWKLPEAMNEISGIVKLGGDSMLAIEDLHANLYFLKLQNPAGSIVATLPFAANQKDKFDIEDVSMIKDTIYALWSHASVFKIWNWRSKLQSKEYETFLDKKNNTEGLAYDPVTGDLLIACKKESGEEDEKKSTKAIYEFDVKAGALKTTPFLLIEKNSFKKFVADKVEFYPSGIAVHPLTHDIYIISTRGDKCIACFSHSGELRSFEYLDKDLLPQPEGICFDAEGNLYISTEARHKEPAMIYEFGKTK